MTISADLFSKLVTKPTAALVCPVAEVWLVTYYGQTFEVFATGGHYYLV